MVPPQFTRAGDSVPPARAHQQPLRRGEIVRQRDASPAREMRMTAPSPLGPR